MLPMVMTNYRFTSCRNAALRVPGVTQEMNFSYKTLVQVSSVVLIKMAFFNHSSINGFFSQKATEILMLLHYNSVWIVSVSKDIRCWYLIVESCRNNKTNVCNVNDKMIKIPGQTNTFGIIKNLALSTHSKTTCLHHVLVSRSYSVHWLRSRS